ncbi:methyltransferase [Actinokineospora enzanensis]|uniref:methyltransferase n=1 Tax=Actinokineospora enzanensis TaxID=155975 RepID=UPI000376534F|nr:methyltransferase [Actinokineospora enzanensis]
MTAGPDPATLPPVARLLHVTDGMRLMQAVTVLAELGVADELADGPCDAAALADRVGAHPRSLHRVLRAAATGGVFAELPDGRFAQNEVSACLRGGPGALFRLLGGELGWRSFGALRHSVRTGETAFDAVFGAPVWRYIEQHPEHEAVFDEAMGALAASVSHVYQARLRFPPGSRIADLGGGDGTLLAALLRANPECTGVLFDRAAAVAHAPAVLAGAGVADRAEVVGGDFFTADPPRGCTHYLLKSVLHVLDDDAAGRVLRWAHGVATEAGADVHVLDRVLAEPGTWDNAKFLDLDMLAVFGGRDRTLADWRELVGGAGYRLVEDPEPGRWTVLRCRPTTEHPTTRRPA